MQVTNNAFKPKQWAKLSLIFAISPTSATISEIGSPNQLDTSRIYFYSSSQPKSSLFTIGDQPKGALSNPKADLIRSLANSGPSLESFPDHPSNVKAKHLERTFSIFSYWSQRTSGGMKVRFWSNCWNTMCDGETLNFFNKVERCGLKITLLVQT